MKLLAVVFTFSLSSVACTAASVNEPTQSTESKLLDEGDVEPAGGSLDGDCFEACQKAKWGTAKQCENKCTY